MASRINEKVKIVECISPQAVASTTVASSFISLSEFRQSLFLLACGNIAATKSVTIQIVQAKDIAGLGAKDIEGASLALTGAGNSASGFVEIDTGSLDRNNGYSYVAVKVTTDSSIVCGVSGLLGNSRGSSDQDVLYKIV